MAWEEIKKRLGMEPKEIFISVHEGSIGIETLVHPGIERFPRAYKKQVISFLEGIIEQLEEKKRGK